MPTPAAAAAAAAIPTTAAASDAGGPQAAAGLAALQKLKSTDPPLYLSPSEDLSKAARLASEYLFSSLKPHTPKSPFSHLLVNGFDAEQIWQQIDLQTQPLISSLRRQVKNFEKNPQEIRNLFNLGENKKNEVDIGSNGDEKTDNKEGFDGFEDEGMEESEENNDDDDDEEEEVEEEEGEEEEGDDRSNEGKGEDGGGGGVEDKFLKIKELEEYLEEDEAREYGLKTKDKKQGKRDKEEEEEEDDDDEDEEDDDELGVMGIDDGEDDESGHELENARYDDFFGAQGKTGQKRKSKPLHGSDNIDMDRESSGESSDDEKNQSQKKHKLSTHEKELEKLRSTIEQMEKANMEPKTWTMQGEVTAAKRPKNSALEVDLDFEHNVRPTPVITEEVTASLEELIQKRILEGRFDDVQKPPTLPSTAPREVKELDGNKSKKGLAEIYEEEYVQKSGLVSTALSISDQQKKEASMLFKELCLKLDALSHFHFTPKPVIEDMSIQANVPALAMEEIAPLAVSDAAMLAPEEVFAGKGDIKEETELTQADRKRRRAKKKRKFKAVAAKRMSRKAQEGSSQNHVDGNEES